MIRFLEFVSADLTDSQRDFGDDYVRQLQASVQKVKVSREMEERFMVLEEMLRDERTEGIAEGRAEVILELLEEKGTLPEELKGRIQSERDLNILKSWFRIAVKVDSVSQFMEEIQ